MMHKEKNKARFAAIHMHKAVEYSYIFMMLCILACVFFFTGMSYARKGTYLPAFLLIPFGAIFLLGILTILRRCALSTRQLKYISPILFVIQVYNVWNYYFYTDWDPSSLIALAETLAHNGDASWLSTYYSKFPNNMLLALIFCGIEKIVHSVGLHSYEYFAILIVQCIISAASGILVFKIVHHQLGDVKMSWLSYILYMFLVGASPWVSIPYSDSFALLFPVLIFYLYINREKWNTAIAWWAIFGLAVLGYKIKPQTCIIVIAIMLMETADFIKSKSINWKGLLGTALGVVVTLTITNAAVRNIPLQIDEEKEFGIQHFFMMGMNPEDKGVWSARDVDFSDSYSTVNERNKADLERAFERIDQMGVSGVIKQLTSKMLTNYNDGTFGWGGEGTFFATVFDETELPFCRLVRGMYYSRDYADIGKYYLLWSNFEQMLWLSVLASGIFILIAQKDKNSCVIMLSIIGLTVFELCFEARARYLYAYVPLYIILAVHGVNAVWRRGKEEQENTESTLCQIDFKKYVIIK